MVDTRAQLSTGLRSPRQHKPKPPPMPPLKLLGSGAKTRSRGKVVLEGGPLALPGAAMVTGTPRMWLAARKAGQTRA